MTIDSISIDLSSVRTTGPDLILEQQEVVNCTDDNICVIAGPASGKTRLIEAFIFSLLDRGVHATEVLPFTFTITGKEVMNRRLMGTGVRAYSIHGHGMKESKGGRKAFLEAETPDFEDLIRERQPGEKLYEWVLCDEGQDLTEKQFKAFLSWGKRHFLVGDPWQSIFMFAGASPQYLMKFKEEYCNGRFFPLISNHRSGRSVVEAGSRFRQEEMEWGGNNGEGEVRIDHEIPSNLDNLTILTSTYRNLEVHKNYLELVGVPFTFIKSKGGERVARNFSNGEVSIVKSIDEFYPTILTVIHLSKGDEWDRVWVDYRSMDWRSSGYSDEEAYLFYVGITRAKKYLHINDISPNWLIGRLS